MGWMKVLSFLFNLFGVLFLVGAMIVFALGAAVGGATGTGANDAPSAVALLGGMMGTMAATANFLASLLMFFFGAVLWALQSILAEMQRMRSNAA